MSISSVKTGAIGVSLLAGNDFYNPYVYQSIATVTVGSGGSSSVTFSSIPSTYTHLQVRIFFTPYSSAGDSFVFAKINGDTGANYAYHWLSGNGSSAGSSGASGSSNGIIFGVATGTGNSSLYVSSSIVDILDYTNTNKNKTIRAFSGIDQNTNSGVGGTSQLYFFSGLWASTSAISSITINSPYGNFNQYSSFALYGIKG